MWVLRCRDVSELPSPTVYLASPGAPHEQESVGINADPPRRHYRNLALVEESLAPA